MFEEMFKKAQTLPGTQKNVSFLPQKPSLDKCVFRRRCVHLQDEKYPADDIRGWIAYKYD
jgi:hypothetical protein